MRRVRADAEARAVRVKATAWAVLAVSSEKQLETLAHQEAMAEEVASRNGWSLERVFGRGREGVGSGKRGVRAIMVTVIAELQALEPEQRPTWLWMRRVDRTGRGRAAESLLALHAIADLGVRIWDHDTGEVRLDTAEGEIIAGLKAGLARLENEVRSKKSRAAIARKRAAGIPVGRVPYGLQRDPSGRYVVQEPQAEAVRRAFALRIEGVGSVRIAHQLAQASAPYPYAKGERPVRWSPLRVMRLLQNRAYVGTIVDEVTFERAQRIAAELGRATAPAGYPWPLSGAVRCYCGRNMIGNRTGRNRAFPYYVCRASWHHEGKLRMVRAEQLEARFVALLDDLVETPALVEQYRRRPEGPSPALLERAIRAARHRLDESARQRTAVWDLHAKGLVRDEEVQARLDALAVQRDEIGAELAGLERQRAAALAASQDLADAQNTLKRAREAWEGATDEERRGIARVVAVQLGGLCVEPDGTLSTRYPEDPHAQSRRRRRAM